jgi:hypothetical protein
MRNSILGVLGEMVIRVLSGEDLDAKHKSTRDQFLDKLEVLLYSFVFLLVMFQFNTALAFAALIPLSD